MPHIRYWCGCSACQGARPAFTSEVEFSLETIYTVYVLHPETSCGYYAWNLHSVLEELGSCWRSPCVLPVPSHCCLLLGCDMDSPHTHTCLLLHASSTPFPLLHAYFCHGYLLHWFACVCLRLQARSVRTPVPRVRVLLVARRRPDAARGGDAWLRRLRLDLRCVAACSLLPLTLRYVPVRFSLDALPPTVKRSLPDEMDRYCVD